MEMSCQVSSTRKLLLYPIQISTPRMLAKFRQSKLSGFLYSHLWNVWWFLCVQRSSLRLVRLELFLVVFFKPKFALNNIRKAKMDFYSSSSECWKIKSYLPLLTRIQICCILLASTHNTLQSILLTTDMSNLVILYKSRYGTEMLHFSACKTVQCTHGVIDGYMRLKIGWFFQIDEKLCVWEINDERCVC